LQIGQRERRTRGLFDRRTAALHRGEGTSLLGVGERAERFEVHAQFTLPIR
jgi:hypothetical protein